MKLLSYLLTLTCLSVCPSGADEPSVPRCAVDGGQRLNEVQVIGSHNSYKQAIEPALLKAIATESPEMAKSLEYSHPSLSEQLSLGLRNLEIDVYVDSLGGRYARPRGLELITDSAPYDPEGIMLEPGFKVFHVPDIDFRSHCLTLKQCLEELKKWSIEHPRHHPVFITIEMKDQAIDRAGFTVPEKWTFDNMELLDRELREHLGFVHLLVPDQVRGEYDTLEKAVLQGGWPCLETMKGKYIFILDDTGKKRDSYVEGHPSLKERVLFVNAPEGRPEAAIMILNDPIIHFDEICDQVRQGYIVRTRADSDTKEARMNHKQRFDAACRSGAQIISTDYYQKSAYFDSDYEVRFEGSTFSRGNPLLTQQNRTPE